MSWMRLLDMPGQIIGYKDDIVSWEVVDGKIVHLNRVHKTADVESFEVLEGRHRISRDKNHIYIDWSKVSLADRDTFKPVGDGYFTDKNLAFYEYETSIKPLKSNSVEGFKYLGFGYARDARFGYRCGRILKNCKEPMKLHCIEGTDCYATDGECIFFYGAELKGVDPKTWKKEDFGFSRDAKSVFSGSKKLAHADPQNWRLISNPYSTDGKNVYDMFFKIKDVDLASFEVLDDEYCRDNKSIFFGSNKLDGAELSTWRIIKSPYSADRHSVYYWHHKIKGVDPDSFEVSEDGSIRDKISEIDRFSHERI